MPDYRRAFIPGGSYFFTLVTHQRRPILCDDILRVALREAIITVQQQYPFDIDAWVLLPDHLHCIWVLPAGDVDYSRRWSMIKRLVTQRVGDLPFETVRMAHPTPEQISDNKPTVGCAARTNTNPEIKPTVGCAMRTNNRSASRIKRREGSLWQRRFWEHCIQHEIDLNRCRDYLHWNPVKHGLVSAVSDWPYSTFHRFVKNGFYDKDWGGSGIVDNADFGE